MARVITKQTLRRFVLGRQSLWPGRRWQGQGGAATALRSIEGVQVDPLNAVAHSHDIVLWSRVADYRPEDLEALLYRERSAFEYGGAVFIYPMSELPFWRLPMRRRQGERRWGGFAAEHVELLEAVRAALRERGPLGSRDFEGGVRTQNYRGSKETSLALYALWLFGEVMVHRRRGIERVYALRELVAPEAFRHDAPDEEAEAFFLRKTLAFRSLASENEWRRGWAGTLQRPATREEGSRRLAALLAQGEVEAVSVEGSKSPQYVLTEHLPLLDAVAEGGVPPSWRPLGPTTQEEAVFLAPLDIVSARERAKSLFDFDYVWEVYKPAEKRRFGYYTMPILYGDRLVGRIDPKLDRKTATLQVLGLWLEPDAPAGDADFLDALGRCLLRFAAFTGAGRIDLSSVASAGMRSHLQAFIASH